MIKAFALGGLEEIGKNLFVVEYNNEIFVFDCGVKNLKNIDLGFNSLLADFSYLKKHAPKIKGLFLTKIDTPQSFGVNHFLKQFPNVAIYASPMSVDVLRHLPLLTPAQKETNLRAIAYGRPLPVGSLTIESFATATCLLGSCGYVLTTPFGRIIFTGDFVIGGDGNIKLFTTAVDRLFSPEQKNLLLVSNVGTASTSGFTVPKNFVDHRTQKVLQKTERHLYIACFENDWYKIFSLMSFFSRQKDGPLFSFVDPNFAELFQKTVSKHTKLPLFDRLQAFAELDWTNPAKKIIFVTGDEKWLFSRITRIINENEPTKKLSPQDCFLFLGGHQFINELSITNVINELSKTPAQIQLVDSREVLPMQAAVEDLKLMVDIVRPKYFFPFAARHSELLAAKMALISLNLPAENIFLAANGDVIELTNQAAFHRRNAISAANIYIDNLKNENIPEAIVRERKLLSSDGVLFISFGLTKNAKGQPKLATNIEIQDFGLSANQKKVAIVHEKILTKIHFRLNRSPNKNDKPFPKMMNEFKKEIETMIRIELRKSPLIYFLVDQIDE